MLKSFFLPAPTDGLNLRASPYELKITEAQQLDNYLVYDWGIRETGSYGTLTHPASGIVKQLICFKDDNGAALELICVANKVYLANNPNWTTPTDMTGALTITSDAWRYCIWNKRIFMVNSTDAGLIYTIAGGSLAADTWTGLTTDNASQVFAFKQRLYYIEKNSTSFWYGPESSVSGALSEYDVSDFLEDYGTLLFGTSWSVNQGNYNEQLFIIVTSAGEVLVYSGDSPEADNWALVTRISIPMPIGNQAFTRLGQDLLICTSRGVISLAAFLAGRGDNESYYLVSGKLADTLGTAANVPPIRDSVRPFMYFPSSSSQYVYALNYERGAWSRINTGVSSSTITAMAFYEDTSGTGAFLNMSFANSGSRRVLEGGNTESHIWRSGFLAVEPDKYKQVQKMKVIGRNTFGTDRFSATASVAFDVLTATTESDTKTVSTTSTDYTSVELQPPGIGRRPSVYFSKTSASERNEIVGCDMFYTYTGGQE